MEGGSTLNLTSVALDIAAVSILLLIAFYIREKFIFFRKYFIPVSLIAGLLGLLLGPQVLGAVSPIHFTYSKSITQWTNFLFCFIFSTSFLGATDSKFGRDILSTTFIAGSIHMVQIILGLLIAYVLGMFILNVPYQIGLLPVAGFYGGHGSAGIIGASFAAEGMDAALGIAMTYATVGMFAAVIGGMAIINYGAHKGFTKYEVTSSDVEELTKGGIISKRERKPLGFGVSDASALDPLAFQFMIVGTVIGVSYIIRTFLIQLSPFWNKIPLYTMCLLFGFIIGQLLSKTKYNDYIDRGTMKRISGLALEFMIVAAVATIQIEVLATYLVPILLSSAILCAVTAILAIYLAKRWYGDNWFELALGVYGQCTGNLATGLLLIKVLDPNGETMTSESISGSSTLGSAYQLPYTTLGPMFLMAMPTYFITGSILIMIAFFVIGAFLFGRKQVKAI